MIELPAIDAVGTETRQLAPSYYFSNGSREPNVPSPLHKEIRWFKQEIALCEQVIAEVESDAKFGPRKRSALAKLRATLAVHREKLAELETRLARE